jgi:periplasmic protein CpxP/Spy
MMKHLLLAFILAGVIYSVTPSMAQDSPASDPQSAPAGGPPEHSRGHFDPARRSEMLAKHLKLSSDQQAKVLDILKSEQSQMESLRSDASTPQQDRRSKMMEIHKASDDQIRGLLDSDQQTKFDAMQTRREQWQGHRQGGQASPSPDAAPQN